MQGLSLTILRGRFAGHSVPGALRAKSHPAMLYSRALIPTVKGAGTSIFTPELDRLFLAVPQADNHAAELHIFQP